MAYKTIQTVITDARAVDATLEAATLMAEREDAHLDILAIGIDTTQVGYYYAGAPVMLAQEAVLRAQTDAKALEEAVQEYMERQDVRWACETAVAQVGTLSGLIGMRARFSDLVVLPRPYGNGRGVEAEASVESALFDGQAPVLVVPDGGLPKTFGNRVVIAWNQSNEALAAVRRALPVLIKADLVNIVVIDPPQHGPERSDPGGALSLMLARHGVKAEVSVLAKTMPRVSDILARHVRDENADLLVMGAYGHSRFREAILGGATRNMLEKAEVPVLMAH